MLSNISYMPLVSAGNMHHLIVEACIARNLLDTSAYFWPGYVNGNISHIPHSVPAGVPGWSSLMQGAPLTPVMINALVSRPASRYIYSRLLIPKFNSTKMKLTQIILISYMIPLSNLFGPL
jgi:hypothetical protein